MLQPSMKIIGASIAFLLTAGVTLADPPGQLPTWIEQAEAGDVDAAYRLGAYWCFESSDESKQAAGLKLLHQAARHGDLDAILAVARCYQEGIGTRKDRSAYAHFLMRAARAGHAESQYLWAQSNGGVMGVQFLKLAAEQGHAGAMVLRAEILSNRKRAGGLYNPAQAIAHYKQAAELGNVEGVAGEARCLEQGWVWQETSRLPSRSTCRPRIWGMRLPRPGYQSSCS